MRLHGDWYQPGQSLRVPVVAELDENGNMLIQSSEHGLVASVSIQSAEISDRLGNIPRRIFFPDGSKLETTDNDLVDEIQARYLGDTVSTWVHKLESRWSTALMALVVTAGLVFAFVQYGLPPIAARVADNVPLDIEVGLGEQGLKLADQAFLEESELSQSRRDRLRKQFFQLLESIDSKYQYQLHFRSGVGANAFALPGGFVVMTDELVELSQNDEQVLAVLAHEIGHVEEQHGLRILIQNSAATAIVATVTGDVSSVAGLAATIPAVMLKSRNSRVAEAEADQFAVDLLKRTDRQASSLADILQRLYDDFGGPDEAGYLDSHPGILERVEAIEQRM